jgi:hypothetical protein
MCKTKQVLKRINILIQQIGESIERGDIEMGYINKNTEEIDELIKEI